jgi:O-antigen/teichoic acid export membrane protein
VALGTTFIFNGASTQHRAMLQRAMRFSALAIIDILSVIAGMAAGIGMALAGYGYWSLVGMLIAQPAASVVGSWLATGWIPGRPSRRPDIRSMLAYGGAITVTSLIVYLATNIDKVLLGRVWGAEELGIYGRAYQLINLPLENLNATIGLVLFPALARVQQDPARLRRYFLKGYGFLLMVLVPITAACALFSDDIIRVFLGAKWDEAAVIFRLLAPGMLAFAFANPLSWLMLAGGQAGRSLRLAAVMTPLLVLSYALGLPYGPQGVAAGLSITMTLALFPLLQWARRGTLITMRDLGSVIAPLMVSIGIGGATALAVRPGLESIESAFLRLAVESSVFFGGYLLSLLFVMKQKSVYQGLLEDVGLWPAGKFRRVVG